MHLHTRTTLVPDSRNTGELHIRYTVVLVSGAQELPIICRDADIHQPEAEHAEVKKLAVRDAHDLFAALNGHLLGDLSRALSRYGRHDRACPLHAEAILPGDPSCTCGFSKAYARIAHL